MQTILNKQNYESTVTQSDIQMVNRHMKRCLLLLVIKKRQTTNICKIKQNPTTY